MNQTELYPPGNLLPDDLFKTRNNSYSAWLSFVNNQKILPNVQPIIARSWQRCWARVNPFQPAFSSHLSQKNLFATQLVNFNLLSIALPILEDVQQSGRGSSSAVLFSNAAGCILEIAGDEDILKSLELCGVVQGAFLSEDKMGTNAIGLSLVERMPVEVVGTEHYLKSFHQFGSAAMPLFDLSGHPLGTVGIFTTKEKYHSYALGMVMATAKAIEGQYQSEVLMTEQNSQVAELNAILSAISEGILVINSENVIVQANQPVSQLLSLPLKDLPGMTVDLDSLFQPSMHDAIQNRIPVTDREVSISIREKTENIILSLRYVCSKSDIKWIISTIRPIKEVRQLAHHQMGAQASLTLEDIPGSSHAIKQVRAFVRKAAPATASILIHGEPGTGKNALASAIHNLSQNRDGPYVVFACGSIPNEIALTELLGSNEAFTTKPVGNRPSKFELAEGGTLFFQDVDLLPLEAQAILLNVLELGVVQRLGSNRPITVNCRILASTSADMKRLLAQKNFRSDLYYRLSIFSVTIPPLRERPQDIPEIVSRILNRFSSQVGYKVTLGDGVMKALQNYTWPDNILEIEALIGKLALKVGPDGVIRIHDLPPAILMANPDTPPEDGLLHVRTLSELEKQTIQQTLMMCHGNVSLVANILGISRTTLWRKLKTYKIDPEREAVTSQHV